VNRIHRTFAVLTGLVAAAVTTLAAAPAAFALPVAAPDGTGITTSPVAHHSSTGWPVSVLAVAALIVVTLIVTTLFVATRWSNRRSVPPLSAAR
jgi:hypothetical protein